MACPIAERLRHYRSMRNMSQAELAAQIGVPLNTISKIEHGNRKVTLDEAIRLAEALCISLDDLAGTSSPASVTTEVAYRCLKKLETARSSFDEAFQELQTLAAVS